MAWPAAAIAGVVGAGMQAGGSLLGGYLNKRSQEKMTAENVALQKEFAKSGIQWRVEDAKKAGIHPLYALGASTHSYRPQYIGERQTMGSAFARAGQIVGDYLLAYKKLDDEAKVKEKVGNVEILSGLGMPERVDLKDRQITKSGTNIGIQAGAGSLENYDFDEEGYLWLKPTQENADLFQELTPDALKYWWKRGRRYALDRWLSMTAKGNMGRRAIGYFRRIRPKAPKGWEFRFEPGKGFKPWKIRPWTPKGGYFFENPHVHGNEPN